MLVTAVRVTALAILAVASFGGRVPAEQPAAFLSGRSMLHAHNAYPEKGRWGDRIDRALATGVTPIVIEQDLALAGDRSVVSHDDKLTGSEPTLESYFFDRVRPLMERALAERREASWPLVVLHLDFKTNEPAHHRAVWALLQKHQRWLTTADRGTDPNQIMPLKHGPLLALTESGANQEADFFGSQPAGQPLLIFGSVPNADVFRIEDAEQRASALASAAPATLIASRATNYRRWVNFPWQVVERGGPRQAADWTAADRARLAALVNRAHAQGLGVRFYTLNGHDRAAHPEWTASYNFGSLPAVRARWQAAVDAGVDLIATDQYEELAGVINRPR
jgi:glycerophosphoryl diester phosphodiesterase